MVLLFTSCPSRFDSSNIPTTGLCPSYSPLYSEELVNMLMELPTILFTPLLQKMPTTSPLPIVLSLKLTILLLQMFVFALALLTIPLTFCSFVVDSLGLVLVMKFGMV